MTNIQSPTMPNLETRIQAHLAKPSAMEETDRASLLSGIRDGSSERARLEAERDEAIAELSAQFEAETRASDAAIAGFDAERRNLQESFMAQMKTLQARIDDRQAQRESMRAVMQAGVEAAKETFAIESAANARRVRALSKALEVYDGDAA